MGVDLKKMLEENGGKLPALAWPGGYPIYYLDGDGCVLCADCATESLNDDVDSFRPVAYGIHWEGEPLVCENCGHAIESAYGEPEKD